MTNTPPDPETDKEEPTAAPSLPPPTPVTPPVSEPVQPDPAPLSLSRSADAPPPPPKDKAAPATAAIPEFSRRRLNFQDILIALGSSVVGGMVILGLSMLLQWILRGTLAEMAPPIQLPLVVALLGSVAFFISVGLGVWQRISGFIAAIVAGVLVALVLYALWQSNGGATVEGANGLLYGIPGIITAIGMSALGGWIGMQVRIALGAPAALAVPAKVGLLAVVVWAVGEAIARVVTVFALPETTPMTLAPLVYPTAIAFPLLTAAVVGLGYRGGITKSDWSYRWTGVHAAIGGVAGLILFALAYFLTARLDAGLFGAMATSALTNLEGMVTASPVWLRVAYVAVIGLLIPITEGWVWRGIVQTGLTRGMGQVTGYIVAALAYVLKYIFISLSITNLVTLLLIAFVIGILRSRFGTGASTVAHIVTNTLTAILLLL